MKREYAHGTDQTSNMFIGNEVEHTCFFGLRTLFVSDSTTYIDEVFNNFKDNKCEHVYLGANHGLDAENLAEWMLITEILLEEGIKVTVDCDISLYPVITECVEFEEILGNDLFCLILSCKMPYVDMIKNAFVKVDDIDFNATNTGVWLSEAKSGSFTGWDAYTKDEVL
jgi:hypothetical protein